MKKDSLEEPLYSVIFDCPIGSICLRSNETHLIAVEHSNQIEHSKLEKRSQEAKQHPILKKAISQLKEYFHSERTEFDIPLAPAGTSFQKRVWQELCRIPYGETISYATLAERINNPKAVRAVGLANGKNPLSIFIPCHRVIGKNGKLTGYAGGLDQKQILLELEHKKTGATSESLLF